MLHYLVTYVRDSLDKESLDAVSAEAVVKPQSAKSANTVGAVRPRQHQDPSATTSSQSNEPFAPELKDSSNIGGQNPPSDEIRGHDGLSPPAGITALLILVILPLTGMVGCACFRREKIDANVVSARQLSLQGIDALQRGKWDDAEHLFATALEQNPADERAHRHFAEIKWHRGEHKTAILHQEKSVRLSGGDPSLLVQLGEMYLKQGNVDAASECANEAIDANSQLSGAWALRGDIHRQRSEPNDAMECYHRALSHQPHYPHVQMSLAELYCQADRPRRALATLSSLASQYRPDEVPQDVEYQRGLALKSLGRYQDAVETLMFAAQRAEPSADVLYHLSEAQFLAGNAASARLALQAALAKVPSHSAGLKLRDKLERHSQAMTAAVERK
jgi:tetratricopeptide (TPR) repeat protein